MGSVVVLGDMVQMNMKQLDPGYNSRKRNVKQIGGECGMWNCISKSTLARKAATSPSSQHAQAVYARGDVSMKHIYLTPRFPITTYIRYEYYTCSTQVRSGIIL